MQIKISIIIPVFKTEKYLINCLESVLTQTLEEIEVICINDGSPDNAAAHLDEYVFNDSRVTVINKHNEGVASARNIGIKMSNGQFIAFMDSDDYYPNPNVLKNLYTAAIDNHVKVSGGYCIGVAGNQETGKIEESGFDVLDFCRDKGYVDYQQFQYDYGYTSYIFDADLIRSNNVSFPHLLRFQDPPFFVKIMYNALGFYYIDEPTYAYRQPEIGLHITTDKAIDMLNGMNLNLKFAKVNDLRKLYYLTALRINRESVIVYEYLIDTRQRTDSFLETLIHTHSNIDIEYIDDSGYDSKEFRINKTIQTIDVWAKKYFRIRNLRIIKWIMNLINLFK